MKTLYQVTAELGCQITFLQPLSHFLELADKFGHLLQY